MSGQLALVTGASSGIGRAIAVALAARGCRLVLSGRSRERLQCTADACTGSRDVLLHAGDLTAPATIADMRRALERSFGSQLDILVHCGADLVHAPVEQVDPQELRRLFDINVVASFELLREFTPLLGSGSDVVVMNSSHGLVAPAETSPYAASKFALRALADAFRAEVNPRGIRVLSVFCGKTATPMQRRIHEARGEEARYERTEPDMLRAEDVAAFVLAAVSLPRTAEVTDFSIRPLRKT